MYMWNVLAMANEEDVLLDGQTKQVDSNKLIAAEKSILLISFVGANAKPERHFC